MCGYFKIMRNTISVLSKKFGERGIRTLGTLRYDDLANRSLRPLGHPTVKKKNDNKYHSFFYSESGGFEPPER